MEPSADDTFPSRSSSADLLDAFEFFNPATEPKKDNQQPKQSSPANKAFLTSPEIKIIAASNENLATNDDDLNYLDTLASKPSSSPPNYQSTNKSAATISSNLIDDMDPFAPSTTEETAASVVVLSPDEDNELHIETSSESEAAESDNGGGLIRDESMDFDEIMHRPAAQDSIAATKMASEVWAGTDDSGIGVEFKATFSVSTLI